jgi:P-loop Domain of unknown function (DUF2791)
MMSYEPKHFIDDIRAIRGELGAQTVNTQWITDAFTRRHLGESSEWLQVFGLAFSSAITDLIQNFVIYHPGEPENGEPSKPVLDALYAFYIQELKLADVPELDGRALIAKIMLDRVRVGEPTPVDSNIYQGFLDCAKNQLIERRSTAKLIVGGYGAGKSHMLHQVVEMGKGAAKTLVGIVIFTPATRITDPQLGYSLLVDGMQMKGQSFWNVIAHTPRPEKEPILGHLWETLQEFPNYEMHRLIQEWLSRRGCGTMKTFIRQATGHTYTGRCTSEMAVTAYRAAFDHLREHGYQCVILIDELENLAYTGQNHDSALEWLRELVADTTRFHLFLGTTQTYVDQWLAKYPALYDRLWVDESQASPESATWHLDSKLEERADKLWHYLLKLHREAYTGDAIEASIKVVESDILTELKAEGAPPRTFLRDVCYMLDQGRHNLDSLHKRIKIIKDAGASELEDSTAEELEEERNEIQDQVSSNAIHWTGAETLGGTRNKPMATAYCDLRNKGWNIMAVSSEPQLNPGWERVKIGKRGTPAVVNKVEKQLLLWVPCLLFSRAWMDTFWPILAWRLKTTETRLTKYRKTVYRLMADEGAWLGTSSEIDELITTTLRSNGWQPKRVRNSGIAVYIDEADGVKLQWVADAQKSRV